ncbi:hypothetical protein VNI00_015046 [Paramarasmius palmivorus]|uniref:F-box domain-containing protein n=1 Tax=Paramarasmius palmivorus TaxID=297713 RepID=A0AAW0BNB8_9AGAR
MIRPLVSTIFSIVLIMLSSFKRSPFGRRLLASRLAPTQKQCPVPQEIIDMIIDLLRDDISALKACSLASSIFVFRARKYLFNKSVIAISGMARRAPHINLLIRDALHPRGTLNIHSMKRISLEYPSNPNNSFDSSPT